MCKTSAVTEYPTTKDRRLRIRSIPFPHVPLGRLRIGFHGLAGTTALFFTSLAILNVASGDGRPPPTWLSVCVLLTTIWSSVGSMSLFHQVPKQTVIARNVVPPHKEAFARTVSVVLYLDARLVQTWTGAATATTASSPVQWFWACMLVAHTCATMIPRPSKTEWKNGNTYIFILPMALGITVDALHQIPRLMPVGVSQWNTLIVPQLELLVIVLSSLIIAFFFTLCFRGYVNIVKCYWSTAASVGFLCLRLSIKAILLYWRMM